MRSPMGDGLEQIPLIFHKLTTFRDNYVTRYLLTVDRKTQGLGMHGFAANYVCQVASNCGDSWNQLCIQHAAVASYPP